VKVALLAGGMGTRLGPETQTRPKPLIEIGGQPILRHVMSHYRDFGFRSFVIALGYRGDDIKRYFVERALLQGDLAVDASKPSIKRTGRIEDDWDVQLVDTGARTNTGGRIKRLAPYLSGETFMLTWGDGLSDVPLDDLLAFHRRMGRLATVTAVHPPARFGQLDLDGDLVATFTEKPPDRESWINGAFFVCEPEVLGYIAGDDTQWEREPLETLAREGQLAAYRHEGFWQCMDDLRDRQLLQALWDSGHPPWRRPPASHAANTPRVPSQAGG
jgi:glucose-1-phosphate cytidylyltransferase